jgi:hypothetical protein
VLPRVVSRIPLRRRNVRRDLLLKVQLAVMFRRIADDFARIRNAPKRVRIAADAVENLERHAVFIANVLGLDALDQQLLRGQ